MSEKIIISLFVLFFSCSRLENAKGEYNEISIFMSDEDKEYILPYIDTFVNKTIDMPISEKIYKINIYNSDKFFKYKHNRNIILLSLKNPQDFTADLLFEKFKDKNNNNIFSINDMFSYNQLILCINAFDSIEFEKVFKNNILWIDSMINDNINKTLLYYNKRYDLNHEIVDYIKQNYNLQMNIDENYKIIKTSNDFIWIGRGYPYRWITINKNIDKNFANDYFLYTKDILEKSIKSIIINDNYNKTQNFNNYTYIQGLYEHEESDTGGPYFSYIIESNNKLTLISGFVNNPGKTKHKLYKQLDALITEYID